MKNSLARTLCTVVFVASVAFARAQYPTIPAAEKARGERIQAEMNRLSDETWQRALPVVMSEAAKGRPYVPQASKPSDLEQAKIPAFPGAEGGGAYTPGGRGGKVIVVTSLADRGPGTLREAYETGGARIVVFNVADVIKLESPINMRAPYITIAGQTASGDGICVTGASFLLDTHDIITRHMRFRRGEQDVLFRDDALGGNCVGNVIIDHVSASWGLDENMLLYRHVYDHRADRGYTKLPTVNITIQNSMFTEALDCYNHAFGVTIGGHNSMLCRNLFASNISRNCSIGMDGDFNFVNNITYNWWNCSTDGGDNKSLLNIIGNNFKPGPVTSLDKPISYRVVKPEAGRARELKDVYGKAYVNGNIVHGNKHVTADNWDGGAQPPVSEDRMEETLAKIKMNKLFDMPHVTIMDAKEAYNYVLSHVGATFPKRDAMDHHMVKNVKAGKAIYAKNAANYEFVPTTVKRHLLVDSYKKGIVTDPRQAGGLPEYKGTPILDINGDGVPDAWEEKYGLNPNDASDAIQDINGDGYNNIEKYINDIDSTKRIDWTDLKNNHDTLESKKKLF